MFLAVMSTPLPPSASYRPGFAFSPLVVGIIAAGALVLGLIAGSGLHSPSAAAPDASGAGTVRAANHPNPTGALAGAPSSQRVSFSSAVPGSPLAALKASLRAESVFARYRMGIAATARLSPEEIPQALSFAMSLPPDQRDMYLIGTLSRWSELDPRAAALWTAQQVPRRPDMNQLLGTAVAEWTYRDPQAARTWVQSLPPSEERNRAIFGYYKAVGWTDPQAGLQDIASLPEKEREKARESVFRGWVDRDPQAAMRQVAQEDGETQKKLYQAVLPLWARNDPAAAIQAARALDEKAGNAHLTETIMGDWVGRDPAGALAQFVALPESLRNGMVHSVFNLAAQTDPDTARSFAAQLPPGPAADQAFTAVLASEARQNPVKASQQLDLVVDPAARQKAIEAVGTAWAQRDPAAAADWILNMAEGSGRTNAARNLMYYWTGKDLEAAGKWVSALPPGPTYDATAGALAWRISNTDTPTAVEWAASMSPSKEREQTTQMLVERWLLKDPPAAKSWLQSTNLVSPDLRDYLLRNR